MVSAYGRKRMATSAGDRETWMDRFVRLEPEAGFRAVVQQIWNGSLTAGGGTGPVRSASASIEMKSMYDPKRISNSRDCKTWMDHFITMEPDGGFRAVVKQAWNDSAPSTFQRLTAQAA
jgi:hypothetical protein